MATTYYILRVSAPNQQLEEHDDRASATARLGDRYLTLLSSGVLRFSSSSRYILTSKQSTEKRERTEET